MKLRQYALIIIFGLLIGSMGWVAIAQDASLKSENNAQAQEISNLRKQSNDTTKLLSVMKEDNAKLLQRIASLEGKGQAQAQEISNLHKQSNDTVKLFLQIIGVVGLIAGIYFATRQFAKTQEYNRRLATYASFQSDISIVGQYENKLSELGIYLSNPNETLATYNDVNGVSSKTIISNIHAILGIYERMALAIKYNVHDNDIACEFYSPMLRNTYRWAKPFIESVRTLPHGNMAYSELEALSKKWSRDYTSEQSKESSTS